MTNDKFNRWCAKKEGWSCHVCTKKPGQKHWPVCSVGRGSVKPPEYHNNGGKMLRVCEVVFNMWQLQHNMNDEIYDFSGTILFKNIGVISNGENIEDTLRAALEAVATEENQDYEYA